MYQDGGVVELHLHGLGVGDEVRRQVALVELHAFDPFHMRVEGAALFHGDDSILAHAVHGLGDHRTDFRVVVGSNRGHLGGVLGALDGGGEFMQVLDAGFHGLVDAALDAHGARTSSDVLEAFLEDGLGHDRGGRGAISGSIIGLGSDLLDELGAHVLVGVFQLDLFGHAHPVLRDGGAAKGFLNDDVATAGAEGDFDGSGELANASADVLACVCVVTDLFGGHGAAPYCDWLGVRAISQ